MHTISHQLEALESSPFTAADRMLALALDEIWNEPNVWIQRAVALCNVSLREGHAYLDLARRPKLPHPIFNDWPSLASWKEQIARSPSVSNAEQLSGEPLVFCDDSKLYLRKYYEYEMRLAEAIRKRMAASPVSDSPEGDPALQAVQRKFFVITGGPGTGKTTLALRYLARALSRSTPTERPPRIATIAPTGKAAARLSESILDGVEKLEVSGRAKSQILAIPCLTIHRLLGVIPHRSRFRKDARNPIDYDILVVDESSMIDLPLMLRLFEALPDECQVLMLGDKDQLASVEVGSVFSDILESGNDPSTPLSTCIARLTKTYRFSEDSSIYQACQAVQSGDAETFRAFLDTKKEDWLFHALPKSASRLPSAVIKATLDHFVKLASAPSVGAALSHLTDFMVLTPTRVGRFGSLEINRRTVQAILRKQGLVHPPESPFSGTPIIVLENDYELELFNGDLGLVWTDDKGSSFAYFPSPSGESRRCRVSELPRYEAAFALTIHKSQGSEFNEIACVFGPGSEIHCTRELLYTAFSRARRMLTVFGNENQLIDSVHQTAERATRLSKLLR